jgi:hypothetical protein
LALGNDPITYLTWLETLENCGTNM